MMNIVKFALLAAVLAVPAVGHSDQQPVTKEKNHSHMHKHGAHSYQKPGAPIRLASEEGIELAAHAETSITIPFSAPKRGTLSLVAKAKNGLVLTGDTAVDVDLASQPAQIELDITTAADGVYHLMFHAQIDDMGNRSSRVLGVRVVVGDPPRPIAQKPHPSVIKMKAQETVHNK